MPNLQLYFFASMMRLARRAQSNFPVDDGNAFVCFRKSADRMANLFVHPPRGIERKSVSIAGVPGEWFIPPATPQDPVLMFLHGGGMIFG